jgi:hypothetical protein
LVDRFFSQTTAIAPGKHYEPPLRVDWFDEFLSNTTLKEFTGDRWIKTPNPNYREFCGLLVTHNL